MIVHFVPFTKTTGCTGLWLSVQQGPLPVPRPAIMVTTQTIIPSPLVSFDIAPTFSKLFSNGEDGIGFKRMRFSEDSEMTQRWRVSFLSVSEDVKMVVTFGRC